MQWVIAGVVCAALALICVAVPALARDKHKNEEILPLPPEPPMVLAAETSGLDFHISPLLKAGGLSAQIRQSLNDLIRDTHGETIIKLRAFVAGTGDARRVQAEMAQLFTEHKLPLPVLSILQVGALGDPAGQVIIEAVVSTHRNVNPNGLAFLFGQTGVGLSAAIDKLKATAERSGVQPAHLLATTCFTSDVSENGKAADTLRAYFPATQVNIVQSVRDPVTNQSTCEAIGQLSVAPGDAVEHHKDINSTLVNTPELVFTGLQLSFGNYLVDAKQAFQRLQKAVLGLNPQEVPVQVDGFSLDPYAASALMKTNTLAPGVFSVETIEGLPSIDATGGIEAVLAAGPSKAASGVHGF